MNQAVKLRKEFPRGWVVLHLLGMLAAVLLVTGQVDLAWPLDDPFQEAEWAINRAALAPPVGQPVLIHGGLDQVPASVAAAGCPVNAQIACLRAINLGFQLAAGWALVGLVALIAGLGTRRAWCASLPALLAMVILGAAAATPVLGQQSAPGTRDLPLLAALLPMILISRRLDRAEAPGSSLFALLGLIAAAAPFWTYNRGIVTILVAGAFALAASGIRRSPGPVLYTLAGGILGLLAVCLALGPPAVTAAATNILYWGQNGALWRIPPHRRALAEAALPFAAAMLILLAARRADAGVRRPGTLLLCASLAAIFGLYTVQSLDRADPAHLRWTLWPVTLLLALGIRAMPARRSLTSAATAAALLVTAQSAGALAEPRGWDLRAGWLSSLRIAAAGWPTDSAIAGPTLTHVASLVRAAGRCTFAADNAGIVYLLANQPPCTRFAMGAYVAPAVQDEVIASLAATQPAIIPWDAPAWWAHIDGHSLADHAPVLAAWIVQNYPVETRVDGHILRSKASVSP
jgi:hypothetical protein